MGQGFSLAAPPAGAAGIDVPELADLVYEKSIGNGRFMKSVRARHRDGVVLAKVLIKPYPMSLEPYKKAILRERRALANVPNALPYHRAIETETNGYLVRQFLYNSLYDRLSTRPFLEDIEKKWLAFQLLCALRDCHAKDVYHGDIKTENVLVTSWNWLYLSDFSSSFKRVMLPEDNPADFSYFFDTSGKRTCYLAPERFLPPGQDADPNAKVTWAMDIFSAGCVIAELFLETPIFNLAQLFMYRKGEYDPSISHLSRIPDKDLREMIAHMIQLDPEKRYSAEQYLEFWKGKVFPEYFYNFLHQYMELITHISSNQSLLPSSARHLSQPDQRIERVWLDFDKISYFLGYQTGLHHDEEPQLSSWLGLGHFPVRLNIPNNEHYVSAEKQPSADDGTLIFLNLIVSSLRNTQHASAKIKACDILLAFAERLSDEAKLDRVLPYLMALLTDKCDMVVVAAIRTITQLLDLVKIINPVNSQVFLDYIMPRLQPALLNPQRPSSPIVRATYASCLGKLATTATRFLALAAALRADGSGAFSDPEVEPGNEPKATFDGLYDDTRRELAEIFETHTKALIEDSDPFVRRAFLTSVPDLCIFFGAAQANDIILTHLNTYLNDRDWTLKCAFFDTIVGISAFLGSNTLEKFILPLMAQAVTDPEEHVVHSALHSLAELASLGLLTKQTYLELVGGIARFTMHPNPWIRVSAVDFIAAGRHSLSQAYLRVMVQPHLIPYLKPERLVDFSKLGLLDTLQKPLSRTVFDQSLVWASKSEKSDFWKPFRRSREAGPTPMNSSGVMSISGSQVLSAKSAKNEEDEQWLNKLRNLGLSKDDEPKLFALREFIWRLSQIKARDSATQETVNTSQLNSIIPLRSLGITPQTVLFDETRPTKTLPDQDAGAPKTIKDALLDASMSVDGPINKKKRFAVNTYRSNLSSTDKMSPQAADGKIIQEEDGSTSTAKPGERSRDDATHRPSTAHGKAAVGPTDDAASVSSKKTLRFQPCAISLMNRNDNTKASPETGTTEANAFGEVEAPLSQTPVRLPSFPDTESVLGKNKERLRPNHSYSGNDPNILKMLNAMYIDNYPHDIIEYGPLVTPISQKRASNRTTASRPKDDGWKPSGKLVATFSEHTGAINRVVVSPDHQFFLTGGDDGCVKVWDTARLERNITHRSRLTHKHAPGAKVVALCFIESTHSFISCATDGSVHVVKVDTVFSGNTFRYPRLRLLREYQLADGEYAVWCEHFKQEASSVLILATNKSVILGIDLRTMSLLYRLENPVHHGTPTCFCVDRKRNWLCLATSHGVLDLWDLRFKMRLKAWGVPGKGAIYRLAIHPTKGRGKWVCVAGGTGQGEVTVWDLERTLCREVYRVSGNKEGPKGYEAWEVDEDKPEGMLGRFATDIDPASSAITMGGNADRGVRAMYVGIADSISSPGEDRDIRHAFIITAGSDKKLRFWDLGRIENSVVYSGLQPDEGRPTFTASHPTPSMTLNTERWPRQQDHSASSSAVAAGAGANGGSLSPSSRRGSTNTSTTGGSRSSGTVGGRPPRSTVISLQQQQLLKSHLDAVTDVAVLESPYMMSVSVDRSGVVFVFQ